LEYTLFLTIFVYNKNCGIMENNNVNPAMGNKGVWPSGGGNINAVQTNATEVNNQPPSAIKDAVEQNTQQETGTYARIETNNVDGGLSGVLEIDLISFRERGQESRYLSINATGVGQDGNQSETTISIDNEKDFNRLKKFFSQLNWND